MQKRTIQQHIQNNREELDNGSVSSQRKRHLQDELNMLEKYHENHKESDYDPTSLELFCDLNPDSPECRIYED